MCAGRVGTEVPWFACRVHSPDPASNNIYEMTEAERGSAGIASLPQDLHDAIGLAEGSDVLRQALGDHVHESLIR